ncbi:uncharacterized protein DUF3800 [Arcticibacter tournemirensis]|uniref:DUF3800 domain-containing protein n=1 Tax=Arcticibacter tournemirensis TaxID=699437 RepID=A0A5M9GPI7_9SPHI|nr:DUF3800 domain-containing protein [Arcticibacter tournemirensis]KAA8475689.1 DUF3800 domain-containing protein [Arcticibacter tournemirensis]TQM50768.1 uncharacterized protein DUF3800 [Arcticibacter tournemirensis]
MSTIVAFADEYGNNSFEFDSQGSHFIVASVILRKDKLSESSEQIEQIRSKHFQKGEIKSKKVANNHARRIRILQDICQIDFSIYAVIVDKRKLEGEGFKYKASFYKFLNGLVYRELFRTFPSLDLVVDEHGENDFMREFKKYVQRQHMPTLFSGSDFNFGVSHDNSMIQLADFIAGTLARCFDDTKRTDESSEFLRLLKPKITSLNQFPPDHQTYYAEAAKEEKNFNSEIATAAFNSANLFLNNQKVEGQEDTDKVNCVKLLLLYFNNYGVDKYITTGELIRHLNVGRTETLTEHTFRTKVIGKIRDSGVIVVSSSTGRDKGYKLPSSIEDLHKFVNHGNGMILPMLHRLKIIRDKIKLATLNKIDIADKEEFNELRMLLDDLK